MPNLKLRAYVCEKCEGPVSVFFGKGELVTDPSLYWCEKCKAKVRRKMILVEGKNVLLVISTQRLADLDRSVRKELGLSW